MFVYELVYPSFLSDFLESKDWDLFSNRKAPVINGLMCKYSENSKAHYVRNGDQWLPGLGFYNVNDCYLRIIKSNDGFICNQVDEKFFTTIKVSDNTPTIGSRYEAMEECDYRLGTTRHGKMCRGTDDKKFFLLSRDKTPPVEFKKMEECLDSLYKNKIQSI